MQLVLISDTHGLHRRVNVPDGDVLIHAGDLTNVGEMWDLIDLVLWMKSLPHKHKVVVAGNHDFCFEDGDDRNNNARGLLKKNGITYIHDSGCEINGLKFWGTPYTPTFFNWALMRDRGEAIKKHCDMIPNGIDVLISHGPPSGILDQPFGTKPSAGCWDLAQAVERVKPQLHVFGHIHGSYGERQYQGVQYVNDSCVDESYKPINAPIVKQANPKTTEQGEEAERG